MRNYTPKRAASARSHTPSRPSTHPVRVPALTKPVPRSAFQGNSAGRRPDRRTDRQTDRQDRAPPEEGGGGRRLTAEDPQAAEEQQAEAAARHLPGSGRSPPQPRAAAHDRRPRGDAGRGGAWGGGGGTDRTGLASPRLSRRPAAESAAGARPSPRRGGAKLRVQPAEGGRLRAGPSRSQNGGGLGLEVRWDGRGSRWERVAAAHARTNTHRGVSSS